MCRVKVPKMAEIPVPPPPPPPVRDESAETYQSGPAIPSLRLRDPAQTTSLAVPLRPKNTQR